MGGSGGGGAGGHQGPVNLLASLDTLYSSRATLCMPYVNRYDSRGKMLNLQHVSSSQFETGKLDLNNINMMNRLFEILRERCPDVRFCRTG